MTAIKIAKYNLLGEKTGTINIDTRFKNLDFNPDLVSQVITAIRANRRQVLSHTKTRAEVSGTGKKPYRQKGTGNARFGSLRTPIHIGGGIAFGPRKERNFKKIIPKNMRQKALAIGLYKKTKLNELFAITEIKFDHIKTKDALIKIAKLPIKEGNILLLLAKYNKNIYLSFRNIPFINIKVAKDTNCYDLFAHNTVLLEDTGAKELSKILNNKNENNKQGKIC